MSAPDSTTSDRDRPETDTQLETETVTIKTTEAERIREYLNRGDTAVIFPEPVRDEQDVSQVEDGRNILLKSEEFRHPKEPSHEIMALSVVLRNLILQTPMCNHPVG